MTKILGTIDEALRILDNYPNLRSVLDLDKFRRQVLKKYPNGPEVKDGDVTDLYTALFVAKFFSQAGNNAVTPQGALSNLDDCISTLTFSDGDRAKLGEKFCNLGTSSFWDTLTELLLTRTLIEKMPGNRIVVEYPLGKGTKKNPAKDADIAILDAAGTVTFLIDAVTPQRVTAPVPSVPDKIVDWIEKKYDSKFADFCKTNPAANVAVVVCLLKNEHFYVPFLPTRLISNKTPALPSTRLQRKAGLRMGLACSFRCPDGKTFKIDPMAIYPG